MSFAAQLPAAILDTVLGRLALLFLTGAGGDLTAARHAASQMLAVYQPDNEDELRLAAEMISFSFHALEALSQAGIPDVPVNIKLRLQNSAVRLSRAANVAQRCLDQRQNARHAGTQPVPTLSHIESPKLQPKLEQALDLIQATRETAIAAHTSGQTWTHAYQQRQRDKRLLARQITENLKKNAVQTVPPVVAPNMAPQNMAPLNMASQAEPATQQTP